MNYTNQEEAPADFIKRYGAYPEDRLDSIEWKVRAGGVTVGSKLKAFTIGEAFNYIAWVSDGSKEPTHRVLVFDENEAAYIEVHACRFITMMDTPAVKQQANDWFNSIRGSLK
jgi:hypothetical protein